MDSSWAYSLAAVALVSAVSFVGALTLTVREDRLKRFLLYLVAFSGGALLGDVFLHILPELSEAGFGVREGAYLLGGIVLFFALEKLVHWHRAHGEHEEGIHSVVYLTQVGDSLHNFLDGMVIAGSFLVSAPVGVATALAVILHEIPQELGNFAVLVHGGWSAKRALWWNFVSALFAVLGALTVLLFAGPESKVPTVLLTVGAASFIYIALSDILPELHREKNPKKSALHLWWFMLGVLSMALLLWLE